MREGKWVPVGTANYDRVQGIGVSRGVDWPAMRSNSLVLGIAGLALFALGAWVATLQTRVVLLEGVRPSPFEPGDDSVNLQYEARIARLEARIEELRAATSSRTEGGSSDSGTPTGSAIGRVTPEELAAAVDEVLRKRTAALRAGRFDQQAKNFVAGLSSGIPKEAAARDVLITTVGRYLDDRERLLDDDTLQGSTRLDVLRALEADFDAALHKFLPAPEARHVLEKLGLALAGHGRPLDDGRERPRDAGQPEDQ